MLDFRVLGPFEVLRDGRALSFRGSRERALLALLVLNANRIVPAERLVDDLWSGDTPDGALRTLRVYVSRVRTALEDAGSVVVTRPAGYLLEVPPEAIDAVRFERLVAEGRREAQHGDHAAAATTFRRALALWRGPALEEVGNALSAHAEAVRLEEARLLALEDRIDADLAVGLHAEVAVEVEALTVAHPFRERLWGQRMTALYRCGRQADALRAFQTLRRTLADLGLEPRPELHHLEGAILRHEPSVDWRPAGAGVPAPGASPLPAPVGRSEPLPLVGRSDEMARLRAAWADAVSGERRLVLVGGEPGIGKSRLIGEFSRRVHEEDALVLFGRCDEGMAVPYQPFVEALGRYVREAGEPVLGRGGSELTRLVPAIPERVGERIPRLPSPTRSDPESERYRLFEAVAGWLAAASEDRPVALALEDLHWATKPTLLLLSHLVRSDDAMAVLLVVTYRDSPIDVTPEVADALGELLRQPGVERFRLGGLDEDGVATLIEAHSRRELDDRGRALARTIHGETGGNPFFVREVLRHLTEKGDAGHPAAEVDIPDSVREVVGRRLTRLPDKTDQMLALAAVLGEHFELDVLVEASGETADSVLQALDPAISARLVEETAVGRYRFAHALVRATLEDALGATRRAQLHLGAARALEALGGQRSGRAAVLATHYRQAGSLAPTEPVIDALIEAGDEAAAALAWEQVGGYWQGALDLMERTCPGTRRQAELLARLADLLYVTGFDLRGSIAYAEKAVALFDDLGLKQRATVLRSRLAGYLTSNGVYGVMDVARGLALFRQAQEGLRDDEESLAYGYLLGTLSTAYAIWAARPREALETVPRAIALARRRGNEALEVIGEMIEGFALVATGSLPEGFELIEGAWDAADRLDHRILGMRTAHIRTFWALVLREPDVAIRWGERELSKSRLAHVPIQRQTLQGQLAWAFGLTGRPADAERLRREARDVGVSQAYAPALELWQGDWPAAEASLRDGSRRCREMGDRLNEALLYGWVAEACRLQGDFGGAERSLHDGLAIAVPGSLRVVECLFRIDLGVLDLHRHRPEPARRQLDVAAALMAGADWRGLTDRLALVRAALEAHSDPGRAGPMFEQAVHALRARSLPWDEAEAFLLWKRAVAARDPALAHRTFEAATEIYRRCGAGPAWFERAGRPPKGCP